jgi:hypothetical protein
MIKQPTKIMMGIKMTKGIAVSVEPDDLDVLPVFVRLALKTHPAGTPLLPMELIFHIDCTKNLSLPN